MLNVVNLRISNNQQPITMLKDFYKILETKKTKENNILSKIRINPQHQIFEGHFPNLPVVPGVCLMQMIKEILSKHLNKKLMLTKAANIKFLSMVNPNEQDTLFVEQEYKVSGEEIKVNAKIFFKDITYVKFRGLTRSTALSGGTDIK